MHDSEKYGGGDLSPVKFDWTDTSFGSIHRSNIDGASCAMNRMEYKPPAVKPSISIDMDASQQEAAQTMASGMDLNKEATELNNMEYKPPAVKPSTSNDMDASQQEARVQWNWGFD
eukprot:956786_1